MMTSTQVSAALPEPLPSYRYVVIASFLLMACFMATFGGWAMFARLDGAVVTHGVFLAESQRKTVESLEGGILERLLVKPGDHVKAGEVVAMLDATQDRAQLTQLQAERSTLISAIWRLEAELEGREKLESDTAPATLRNSGNAERTGTEIRLFEARRLQQAGQISALRRQVAQLFAQIAASEGQAKAADRQLVAWDEEMRISQQLVDKGATPRKKLLELERATALLEGERDENRALMEAYRQDIARAEAEIETLAQQRLVEITERLSESRRSLAGVEAQIQAVSDIFARKELRAPQDGVVVDIVIVTPGAVVGSGTPLMEINPDGDTLLIQTRLPPESIDTVHVGRSAKARLTAYRRSLAPVVDAELTYVSADLIEDPRDGSKYFDARVTLSPESLAHYPDVIISAGMPVEVIITTAERRVGDYLLEPILRHLRRSMREE